MWLGIIDLSKCTLVEAGIIGIMTGLIIVFSILILPFIVIAIKDYIKHKK